MNNRFIILTLFLLLSTASAQKAWSQRDPLNQKITIKIDNQPVEKILGFIGTKGKLYFSYNSDILPLDSIASVNFERKEIYKILDHLLQNRFYYKTTGQHVIILKKKASIQVPKGKIKIQGTVIEFGTGFKIENASVYNLNGKEVALSNASGNFLISMFPKEDVIGLAISKSNYQDTIIFVRTNEDKTVEVALRPVLMAIASIAPRIENELSVQGVEQSAFVPKFVRKDMIFHAKNITYYKQKLGQISFLPTLGTNYKFSGSIVNNLSLNLISGYSYGTNGIEIGSLLNINRKQLNGIQLSGFGNITGDYTNGLQVAGFFNHSYGKVKGVQLAGFHNLVTDTLNGAQISGFTNILKGKIKGAQIAGFANITTDEVIACQISGFANLALKNSKGLQASGFANISNGNQGWVQASGFANFVKDTMQGIQAAGFINMAKNTTGLQAAGFTNINTKDVKGLQVAGFFNYARKVKGSQIGIINIADTVSGASIGIFNLVRKGFHQISISINETKGTDISLKLGTYRFYSIFGYSTHPFAENKMNGAIFGFGTNFLATQKINFNLDLTAYNFYNNAKLWNWEFDQQYRLSTDINFKLGRHFSLFTGLAFNVLRYNDSHTEFNNFPESNLFPISFQETTTGNIIKGWAGASFGMKFRF